MFAYCRNLDAMGFKFFLSKDSGLLDFGFGNEKRIRVCTATQEFFLGEVLLKMGDTKILVINSNSSEVGALKKLLLSFAQVSKTSSRQLPLSLYKLP
jgi:hypothetical protein